MNRRSSERLLRGALLAVTIAVPTIAGAQSPASRRAPAAPAAFPAQPADRARVVVLHLAATESGRLLSVWSSSAGLAPWVADVGYARWSYADVAPGSQGYVARTAGMEPPTAARLGSNTGAGNLLAGRSYFLVMAQPPTQDRTNTRIEAGSTAAPTDGAAAMRVMGAWPVNRTIDVCVSGDGGERAVVVGLGGRGYFGGPAPGSQALAPGATQVTLHLQQGAPCAGPALGRLRVELAAGQGYALFLHGEAETSLTGVLCRESGAGCQRAAVER
jgi:hypothetical protein